ncbi:TIGR02444 family protein [Oceanospirillum beijerinckii]|uniref:TIGR02444 family protein n=1 Tax=Oceanospirillum beijerinckii TaxID=64976 RepID=UPI0004877092|nr:TIGR02444 family protein [Oceanospirillum beijerinckii]MAC48424.1 TIGR02444 family protein [Oceanospirillum sp.]
MSDIVLEYDNPFWLFSTKLYRLDEVEAACIYLQEHQSVMVNQLLFSCWLATQNTCFDDDWSSQVEPVLGWHNQFVVPLRKQRRQLKPMAAVGSRLKEMCEHLLEAELLAEQHEQALLYLLYTVKKGLAQCNNREEALVKNLTFVLKDTRLTLTSQKQLHGIINKVVDDDVADEITRQL